MGIDSTESFTKKEATIKNTMHAHNFHIGDSMVKEPALYQVYQGLYATKYLYKLNVFSKRNCFFKVLGLLSSYPFFTRTCTHVKVLTLLSIVCI